MDTHYKTLEVSETATYDEIKNSYRRLAMKWHPDKNPGDRAAEEKFKNISAAYEVLGDDNKRREYDMQRNGRMHPGAQPGGVHWNMNFNGHPFGAGGIDDFISQFFNQSGFGGARAHPQRNRDVTLNMTISLEDSYNGKQVPIQFNTPGGRRVELIIDVPKGIDSDTKIRYSGQGDHTNTNMPPGDLYIQISIADHEIFVRNGNNLEHLAKIDAIGAIIGMKYAVNTISGQSVEVNIPSGTPQAARLRVQGRGMPLRDRPGIFGDLIIHVDLLVPTDLDTDAIVALRHIQSKRGIDTI